MDKKVDCPIVASYPHFDLFLSTGISTIYRHYERKNGRFRVVQAAQTRRKQNKRGSSRLDMGQYGERLLINALDN